MIHKQEPIENVLRLLVLLSLANTGLPKKNFDYLRYAYVGLQSFLLSFIASVQSFMFIIGSMLYNF
jgi:hypothetical protein